MANENSPLIVLEGLEIGNRFFSTNTPGKDQRLLADGTVAYNLVGYADTAEEAQEILYGGEPVMVVRQFANSLQRQRDLEWGDNPPELVLQGDAMKLAHIANISLNLKVKKSLKL